MTIVIVGGTGTLGKELAKQLLWADPEAKITIFSRDELKQQEMRQTFPTLRYVIGDIRDRSSLDPVLQGAESVFLVAALKHVDVLERNPVEGIKTNILGTINVAEAAVAAGVKHVVFSSTDKAVLPINTYGHTKAIAERYLMGLNTSQAKTSFSVFKWGNVLGSRGSVIHAFSKSLTESQKICLTHSEMTRFWIHIEDAVGFMLSRYETAPKDKILIPEMKASKVLRLGEAVARAKGIRKYNVEVIGIRAGEKIHEQLESNHDFCIRSDTAPQYSDEELLAMVRAVI